MKAIYRIYTQDIESVRNYVQEHFESCTIISTLGVWKGEPERAIIIEVILDAKSSSDYVQHDEQIIYACKTIKTLGKQEAVLWTRTLASGGLV